jgi:hypothetical protein
MPLPDAVDYGQVRWHAILGVADSADADDEPDAIPASGTVTFELAASVLLAQSGPDPVTIIPRPVVCTFDLSGILRDPGGNSPFKLIATNSPGLSPTGMTWKATPKLLGGASIKPFSFALPAGSVVDLSDFVPLPSSTGTPIVRGEKGDAGVPETGYFTAPIVDDDIFSVELVSNWGIGPGDVPYYDPAGADPGEAALLTLDPATGEPILLRPAGS